MKIIIKEEQIKKYLSETAIYDSIVKEVMSFLNDNYTQSVKEFSNGLEFISKPVVTKRIDDSTVELSILLDYIEYKFKQINKDFLKQCIIDWYNGVFINNKGRLSKNISIF